MSKQRAYFFTLFVALGALAVAAIVGGGLAATKRTTAVSGSITVVSEATGAEQKNFLAVLDGFKKLYPNVNVKYTSAGRNLPTLLATSVQGGNPPDVVLIPQPALMREFANRGSLKPIEFLRSTIRRDWSPGWLSLGTVKGKLYGLYFKGANKSTIWYNVAAFRNAGVTPPRTWPALLKAANTLRASGVPAYSIGGADGWTLTDLFENIYIRTAGAKKYDQLANHRIKWTDPSVKTALRTMAQVVGNSANIAGGTAGALQTDFATSVTQVFTTPPKAAMILEADFVGGVITGSTKAKPRKDFNVFAFPSIGGSPPSVVAGGDAVVMFKDTPAGRALLQYLATPAAATIWAKRGGFSSPNKRVPGSAYADPLQRTTALALARAKVSAFDLSDLQPSAFGGTVGQGEFKLFQDFVRNPRNVDGIAAQLERAAAAAYKK
jgi:ABC-type glycerol-3-phosphate transport system substrate-binding protein